MFGFGSKSNGNGDSHIDSDDKSTISSSSNDKSSSSVDKLQRHDLNEDKMNISQKRLIELQIDADKTVGNLKEILDREMQQENAIETKKRQKEAVRDKIKGHFEWLISADNSVMGKFIQDFDKEFDKLTEAEIKNIKVPHEADYVSNGPHNLLMNVTTNNLSHLISLMDQFWKMDKQAKVEFRLQKGYDIRDMIYHYMKETRKNLEKLKADILEECKKAHYLILPISLQNVLAPLKSEVNWSAGLSDSTGKGTNINEKNAPELLEKLFKEWVMGKDIDNLIKMPATDINIKRVESAIFKIDEMTKILQTKESQEDQENSSPVY